MVVPSATIFVSCQPMAWWPSYQKGWSSEGPWPTDRQVPLSGTSWTVADSDTWSLQNDIRCLQARLEMFGLAHSQFREDLAETRGEVREVYATAEQAKATVRDLQEAVSALEPRPASTLVLPASTGLPPAPPLPQHWGRQCLCCRVDNAQLLKVAPPDAAGESVVFKWTHRQGPVRDVYGYAFRVFNPKRSRDTYKILQSMRDSKLFQQADDVFVNALLSDMEEGARIGYLACYWHKSAKHLTIELQCTKCNFIAGADLYTDVECGATPADYSMARALLAKMLGMCAENALAA